VDANASDGEMGCPDLWRLSFSRHGVRENTMAEFTKGIENLQDAIVSCEQASAALAAAEAAEAAKAKTDIDATLTSLHEVSGKFFMKTMMSVPPTKACKTEAAAVAALIEKENWGGLPPAVDKLQKATKALVTKAKMDGTTIT
jgi:hypothetical protein